MGQGRAQSHSPTKSLVAGVYELANQSADELNSRNWPTAVRFPNPNSKPYAVWQPNATPPIGHLPVQFFNVLSVSNPVWLPIEEPPP
jgi:hypothetical protein